ncbi:DUF72 domain-containing protein [Candidatus Obscuribacterales bacterium]|nr:DUF72 domain-containing protein [Candidatus Obscuribacterales bacterium]
MTNLLIGTSGWVYDSWRGLFYPPELKAQEELRFFAEEFSTVEINYTFYKLPEQDVFSAWRNQVPKDFLFSVKASRFLTHMKKLKDAKDPWERILERTRKLKSKCGPILLQFPEKWKKNKERLEEFLKVVRTSEASDSRLVFELRNSSWACDDILDLLRENNAAFCIADSYKFQRFNVATADFVYFRYHGMSKSNPDYSKKRLRKEAKLIESFLADGLDVFVYFNNDTEGFAIENARVLKEMLT